MPRVKKPLEPWEMTPAQLEEELEALIKRQAWLENQPKCDRPSCDGRPHAGAPYPHDPTYRQAADPLESCLLYTSPSPRDGLLSRMPSSA